MNVRRGFFRIWVVVSGLWIATVFLATSMVPSVMTLVRSPVENTKAAENACVEAKKKDPNANIFDCFDKEDAARQTQMSKSEAARNIEQFFILGIGGPAILLAGWFVVLWLWRGFARQ